MTTQLAQQITEKAKEASQYQEAQAYAVEGAMLVAPLIIAERDAQWREEIEKLKTYDRFSIAGLLERMEAGK